MRTTHRMRPTRPASIAASAMVLGLAGAGGCAGILDLQDDHPLVQEADAADATSPAPAADAESVRDATTAADGSGTPDSGPMDTSSSETSTDAASTVARTAIALIAADAGFMPMKLALDDTYIYFSEANTGGIYRIAKTGGMPLPYWEGITFPFAVAVDDATVYWGDVEGVWRCPKAGCPGGMETAIAPSIENVQAIAIDQANVYWTDDVASQVLAAPLTGATAGTQLWSGPSNSSPLNIATDGQHVYFTSDDGRLHIVDVDGGAASPSTLGGAGSASLGVTVQGSQVFWTAGGAQGKVLETPTAAPTSASALLTNQNVPGPIVSDGVNLYWLGSDGDAGTLHTCAIDDCQSSILAGSMVAPCDVVVDTSAVYYSDQQGGVLWKLPK
jgi:hypothetical protein